jgi:hypothetical protein
MRPRPPLLLALLIVVAMAASGCITATNVVKLKPDGSGTLEATILVNTAMLEQLGAVFGGEGKSEGKTSLPSPDELAKELSKLKGVRLVSQEAIKQGGAEGARVILAFDDVNQISVSEGLPGKTLKPKPGEEVTFALTRPPGGNSLLTITFPDKPGKAIAKEATTDAAKDPSKDAPAAPAKKVDAETLKMLRGFFTGMRVMIGVEVEGTLVRTSSPYVEGNRVTLLDFDMDELMKDPVALEKLNSLSIGPDLSVTQVRDTMAKAGVKGLKVNDPRVTIEFR